MICFVGQVGTDMKGREAFQEIDYRAVFGTMAKWAVEIEQVDRIPEILARAWMTATTGRPGPVVIALPEDMLTSLTDAAPAVWRGAGVRGHPRTRSAGRGIGDAGGLNAPADFAGGVQLDGPRPGRVAGLCRDQ